MEPSLPLFLRLIRYRQAVFARIQKASDHAERQLQRIPTVLFVGGAVLILVGITLWVAPSDEKDSFKGVVRVLLGGLESIGLIAAVILYFKETPDRREANHYEAFRVIDAAHGVETSFARKKALEELNRDGVSLKGIDLPGADLTSIDLNGADLREADLSGADFRKANLSGVRFFETDLSGADLREADLSGSHFPATDLSGASLWRANVKGATLFGTRLNGTILIEADLSNTRGLTEERLSQAKLCRTKLPNGIDLDPDRDCPSE